jgi:hypothetical protein
MAFAKKKRFSDSFTSSFAVLIFAGLLFALGAQSLFAQTGHANIVGVVTDSQGAVIAGATVTATNQETGVATPTTTNGAGSYSIIQLIPGTYTIKVEKEGFSSQQQTNYTLVAEQNAGVNFTLNPGKVTENVTVQAGAIMVHTETAELGQTINEHSITELPLNGRNPASLVLLTPGTVDIESGIRNQGIQTYTTSPAETSASTNGGRAGSTLYLLDGAYNMDNYQLAAAPFPNPDAVEEFSVIGNNFDPRYGFTPGGVVSIVTKSGTNNWHGDAFDFLRNGGFNAKDYFSQETNKIHRNQFGGSIGGPLVKDKLFIFGNYQGTREDIFYAGSNGYIPTTAMMNGDFSAFCGDGTAASFDAEGLCKDRSSTGLVEHQIYVPNSGGYPDVGVPLSTIQSPTFGGYYPFNKISNNPSAPQLDTAAVNLAKVAFNGLTTLNSYGSVNGVGYFSRHNSNEETFRGDYNLNEKNRIFAKGFLNFFNQPPVGGENLVQTDRSWVNHYQNYSGTWTWTVSPRIVNNVTFAYTRMYDNSNSGEKINGKGICFSQFIAVADSTLTPCSIMEMDIGGGYESTGGPPINTQNFNAINRYTWGISDNVQLTSGKHLVALGVDVLRQYWYMITDWSSLPRISFGGGPDGYFSGQGFSDFLLGQESYYYQDGGANAIVHAWMIAPYAADQIKLKPNLTLSAGLRWEPWIAPVIASGRTSYYDPGHQSTRYPNAPLGMLFPGDAGVPSAGAPSDYKKFFDPRLGLAWQPKAVPNTSIRAAFGMYATPIDYSTWNHVQEMAPFSPSYSFSSTTTLPGASAPIGIIPFDNPWSVYTPLGGQNPFPAQFANPGAAPGSSAPFSPPINILSAFALNYTDGRTYTWNASIEHQFGRNWLARAAYVASESDHQSYQNEANPGPTVCGPVSTTCAQVTQFPLRNDPNRFGTIDLSYSEGTASYQSGQFTLERKMSHGLQFTANYTYSHNIDIESTGLGIDTGVLQNIQCIRCNRSNSYIDVPQVFTANFVYETPTLAGWNEVEKLALGGWQLSGIYRAESGFPFSIWSNIESSWTYNGGQDHAVFASGVTKAKIHPGQIHGYIDPSSFDPAGPPQGSNGLGRTPPGVYTPGQNDWDLGMTKNFRFTERYRFQFRWEMFNAFNKTSLGVPAHSFPSGSFGNIYGTGPFPSRVMQGAVKLFF